MIFFLIGITGVGKSTVGKNISRKLGYTFIDLDALVELRNGMRVSDIFDYSEESFRICETKALKSIRTDKKVIVATGGGVVERQENIDYMKSVGKIILLDRPLDKIIATVNPDYRPLLKGDKSKIYKLYERRKPMYYSAADVVFSTKDLWIDTNKVIEFINSENSRKSK